MEKATVQTQTIQVIIVYVFVIILKMQTLVLFMKYTVNINESISQSKLYMEINTKKCHKQELSQSFLCFWIDKYVWLEAWLTTHVYV